MELFHHLKKVIGGKKCSCSDLGKWSVLDCRLGIYTDENPSTVGWSLVRLWKCLLIERI